MFTGLIETIGTIAEIKRGNKSLTLGIKPDLSPFDSRIGASVAIDGICLTMECSHGQIVYFTAVYETLQCTTLNNAAIGKKVNLERALAIGDRLDGHMVLGHVDGIGKIVHDTHAGDSLVRTINVPKKLVRFLALKGSVAIDGISLTISKCQDATIDISFIPHTLARTTMADKRIGDLVNLECDVLARYVGHMLAQQTGAVDKSLLNKMESLGF